jgi:hypothetical protein
MDYWKAHLAEESLEEWDLSKVRPLAAYLEVEPRPLRPLVLRRGQLELVFRVVRLLDVFEDCARLCNVSWLQKYSVLEPDLEDLDPGVRVLDGRQSAVWIDRDIWLSLDLLDRLHLKRNAKLLEEDGHLDGVRGWSAAVENDGLHFGSEDRLVFEDMA